MFDPNYQDFYGKLIISHFLNPFFNALVITFEDSVLDDIRAVGGNESVIERFCFDNGLEYDGGKVKKKYLILPLIP